MGAKNTERKKITFYHLKTKTSNTDLTPIFCITEKVDGKKEIKEKFDSMDGHLTSIEHKSYQYEGQENFAVEMTLTDDDGSINRVSAGLGGITIPLLNLLASQDKIGKIDISVWLNKKPDTKSGKFFPSISVKNDWALNGDPEQCTWKYKYSEYPHATKIEVKKKTVYDDEASIAFWCKVIDEEIKPKLVPFKPKIEDATGAATTATQQSGASPAPVVTNVDNDVTDDLPF